MTNLREQAGESFQGGFRGQLFAPGDEGYDEARKIYNAMIDKRPGLVARCADVADVISAVNLARDHDWTLAHPHHQRPSISSSSTTLSTLMNV